MQDNMLAQAELALHKREAAARGSSKPQGRAGGDSRLAQSSGVDSSEAGLQAELAATREKLSTVQKEAQELSTSLAKASSFIEVYCFDIWLQQEMLNIPNLQDKLAAYNDLCVPAEDDAGLY